MSGGNPPKRHRFSLAGVANMLHLNVRKEGPDDEKILAVDLKLTFEKVDRAICAYFDDALAPFLWRHETAGLIERNQFLEPVAYMNVIEGAHITINGHDFLGDVKKFKLSPRDGGVVDVACGVSIFPSSGDVADLAVHVQDGVQVRIDGPADLFDDGSTP